MTRNTLVIALLAACAWVVASSNALAQFPQTRSQYPNRSVSRPALSPYSQMYGGGYGVTDPFMSYMRQYMPQTQRPSRRDVTSAGATTAPLYSSSELLRARARTNQQQAGAIAPTGSGSTFMNLGHFYTMPKYRR